MRDTRLAQIHTNSTFMRVTFSYVEGESKKSMYTQLTTGQGQTRISGNFRTGRA